MRIYTVSFENVTVSAVQDWFEVVAPTAKSCCIIGMQGGQSSDFGDAQDELLRWRIIQGFTVSGSGGGSFTPVPDDTGDAAFGGTAEINNTTVANTGTTATKHVDVWAVRGPLIYLPVPEKRIWFPGGVRIVVNMPGAPIDALSMSLTLSIGECG